MIRLPKLFEIIDISKFDKRIDFLFANYGNNKITIIFYCHFIFKVLRLIIIAIALAYIFGCVWYLVINDIVMDMYPTNNFINHYDINSTENTPLERYQYLY